MFITPLCGKQLPKAWQTKAATASWSTVYFVDCNMAADMAGDQLSPVLEMVVTAQASSLDAVSIIILPASPAKSTHMSFKIHEAAIRAQIPIRTVTARLVA